MATLSFAANAQERAVLDFYTRVDYNWINGNDIASGEESGFCGRYIFLRGYGDLGNGFKYSFAQRLNTINTNSKNFDSTDWSFLEYTTPGGFWTFTGGKIVMDVGSYEYDSNPIDIPFFSHYVYRVDAYLPGVSAAIHPTANDSFAFLLTRSPYDTDTDNYLGYALEWRGHHGCWHPIYTIGAYEQNPYDMSYQVAFGNLFQWDKGYVEVDYLRRAIIGEGDSKPFSHHDYTFASRGALRFTDRWSAIYKVTRDFNNHKCNFDLTLPVNTNNTILGAGFEYYPIKNSQDIRLFGIAIKSIGDFGGIPNEYFRIDLGLKWKINLITVK